MEKPGNEKLSKPLLPLILLLMLVILITVIISNLRRDIQQPLTDMQPIPGTPALSTSITTTDSPVVEIFSKEEQIISTAIKKYRLGEIREAENDFRTILVFDPNHQAALTYLGTIFFSQKKYKEAELLFRRETEHYSGNPVAFRNLSLTLLQQGKFNEALTALKQAAELSPDNRELQIALAKLYAYTGDVENTDKHLSRAKNLGADLAEIMNEEYFRPLYQKLKAGK